MSEEIICGINPVKEALRGTRKIFELFIADGTADQRVGKLIEMANEKNIPSRRRSKNDITRLAGTDHHQGVALRIESFSYTEFDDILTACAEKADTAMLVILDGILDPHNLGALIRSAASAGAAGVIIPRDRATGVTATAEKVAAGAAETIPISQVTNISVTLEHLKSAGFWVFGADEKSSQSLYKQNLTGNIALVIGGEGEGIRPLVRKKCDVVFSIPLAGGVGSLNASVAGGIAMFEAVRQRLLS